MQLCGMNCQTTRKSESLFECYNKLPYVSNRFLIQGLRECYSKDNRIIFGYSTQYPLLSLKVISKAVKTDCHPF